MGWEDEKADVKKAAREVDEKAKAVSVKSVKRLSEVTAMCLIPKKRRS